MNTTPAPLSPKRKPLFSRRFIFIFAGAIATAFAVILVWLRWFHHGLPANVREALHSSTSTWTLVSLEPDAPRPESGTAAQENRLYGFRVLGELPLTDPSVAIEAMDKIDRRAFGLPPDFCFRPRQAIKGKMSDGHSVDLLICYECGNLRIYIDGNYSDLITFGDAGPTTLNDLLKQGGVPLPPQPGEETSPH